ncbi:MAG: hypothetical protein AAFX04_05235 [Pseudomonadota bacterium]
MSRYDSLCLIISGCLIVSGCGVGSGDKTGGEGSSLDDAAIAAGVIVDPAALDLQGLYENDTGLGSDRFCAIRRDDGSYQVGLLAVFGANSQCEATGEASMAQGQVTMRLTDGEGKNSCILEARFDGAELQIAGIVEDDCASMCSPRASFAGVEIPLIDDSADAALRAKGRDIESLCKIETASAK